MDSTDNLNLNGTNLQKTVLLVEDEAIIAMSTSATLEEFGYNVLTALTGEKAVKTVRENESIDLVLMDVDLGKGIDGAEAARQILEIRELPVVFLSSHTDADYVERVKKITRYGYISKEAGDFVLRAAIDMAFQLYSAHTLANQREQSLRQNEQRYRDLFESTGTATCIFGDDTIITMCNSKFADLMGYSVDEIQGKTNYRDFVAPEYHPMIDEYHRQRTEGKSNPPSEYDFAIRTRSGRKVDVHMHIAIIAPEKLRIASLTDITYLKNTEKELRESRASLDLALHGTQAGIWQVTFPEGIIKIGAEDMWQKILGYTSDDFPHLDLQIWLRMIHPDDYSMVSAEWEKALTTPEYYYNVEYRMLHKNGHWVWVNARGVVTERDPSGKPLVMHGTHVDVTPQKQVEAALMESEERFRIVLENLPGAVFAHYLDGKFILINKLSCTYTGYTRDELMNMTVEDIDADVVDRNDRLHIWERLKPGQRHYLEARHKRKDGSVYPVQLYFTVLHYRGKKLILAVAEDIEPLVQMRAALAISERRYRTLFDIAPEAIIVADIQTRKIVDCNRKAELMTGRTRDELLELTQFEIHPEGQFERAKKAFKEGADTSLLPMYKDFSLLHKDGHEIPVEISPAVIELHGKKLALGFFRDITQRLEEHRLLIESEKRYRTLFDAAQDAIFIAEIEGGLIVDANPRAAEMIGRTRDEIVGEPHYTIHPPDQWLEAGKNVSNFTKDSPRKSFTFHLQHRDGHRIPVEINSSLFEIDGKKFLLGIFRDVTEQVAWQEELIEVNATLQATLNALPDLMFEVDGDGIIRDYRVSDPSLLAAPPEEFLDRKFSEVIPENASVRIHRALEDCKNGRDNTGEVYSLRHKDGTQSWFHAFVAKRENTGSTEDRYIFVIRDITDLKKTEEDLKRNQRLLQTSQKIARLGSWEIDFCTGDIRWSEQAYQIFGIDPDTELSYELLLSAIHPDDRDSYDQAYRESIGQNSECFEREYRIIHGKTGGIHTIHEKCEHLIDEDGEVTGSVGIVHDITDRREFQQQLEELNQRLMLALKIGNLGIWDQDLKTRELHWDEGMHRIYGIPPDQFPRNSEAWMEFVHPEDRESIMHRIQTAFEDDSVAEANFRIIRPDGEVRWVRSVARVISDSFGKPVRALGVTFDITTLKRYEETLIENNKRIQSLLREKDILLREVHHRIKNNMTNIESLLRLQSQNSDDPSVSEALISARSRVRSMRVLYDKLYRSSQVQHVSIAEYLSSLADEIVQIHTVDVRIDIRKQIEDFDIPTSLLFPLGIIVNELITNAIKYAFDSVDAGEIDIVVNRCGEKAVVHIKDNGRGLPDESVFEDSPGFGLQLVRMLTRQLNGNLEFRNEQGTGFILEFPVEINSR